MNRICIIGGANIDICGASIAPLRTYDSNPGQISLSFGGVGRNIAQICALLGCDVEFVTCFSGDNYGTLMRQDCEKLGMKTAYSKVVDDLPSSMYIAILDHDHDMQMAMSDMRILRRMDTEMLDPLLKSLDQDDMLVVDANLDLGCIAYILENAPCPVAADPVSTNKAGRLKDYLNKISIFKPNRYEAEELTGIHIETEEDACRSIDWFLEQGVQEVIISMADKGLIAGTSEKKTWFRHRLIKLENATGGGDSFLGAYVSRRILKESVEESVRFAISAAVTTIEQDAVRRRSLSSEAVKERISNMEIKEKTL